MLSEQRSQQGLPLQNPSFQKSAKASVPITIMRASLSEAKRNFTDFGTTWIA